MITQSEYPYAGIPRIVIETENYREIKDRETEIPAKLQIWGAKAPESELMDLTIRGRGNTSWTEMPKKSYKIEFINKQEILGMSKEKDWVLLANYADKTLIKNLIAFQLSFNFKNYYTPQHKFVELYLNQNYLGVYQLCEAIKISRNRINSFHPDSVFLAEIDHKYKAKDQMILSSSGKPFNIHYPKEMTEIEEKFFKQHIDSLETFLYSIGKKSPIDSIAKWFDLESFAKIYWIQEFAKNNDAGYHTSVYFSWQTNKEIFMGPIWDFDITFGVYDQKDVADPTGWLLRTSYWNKSLFNNHPFSAYINQFWFSNRSEFEAIIDSIDVWGEFLKKAAKNNFKRWDILRSTRLAWHPKAYSSYEQALDDLKKWIEQRIQWIDDQINNSTYEQ